MRFRISTHSKYSILIYNGPGNALQNCSGSQFGPARIHIPNDISIGSAVSAQLTVLSRLAVDMKFCTHILIHRFYVDIHGWIYLYPQVPLSPVYMYYDSCIIMHGDKNLSPSPTFPVVPVPIHIPPPLFLSTFPSPWYNISLTQLTNHQLVLFSSRRMFT